MLVLTRTIGQGVVLPGVQTRVSIIDIKGKRIRLGVQAPPDMAVHRDEIWASVESVHAAIEIVDTRLANWREADRLWVLADNQSNGGFVYDPDGIAFRDHSFAEVPVRLTVNGRSYAEGRGGNPAGDPRWLTEWLVNHCAQRRGGLRAGAMVTTGSYTDMIFVQSGASVEATFDGIGTATVSFL